MMIDLGAEIDEFNVHCTVQNHLGKFQISITTGTMVYFPRICIDCLEDCKQSKSLCIVDEGFGWTNMKIQYVYLFVLAQLYMLRQRWIPETIWDQIIELKNKCKTRRRYRNTRLRLMDVCYFRK